MDDAALKEKFLSVLNSIPRERLEEGLGILEEFARNAKTPPLPSPNSGYPLYDEWKRINKSRDGKKCLEQHWGQWLKAFNKNLDRDYMSQADLGRLDKKLLTRLKALYSGEELNTFLPSISNYYDQTIKKMSPEEKREVGRMQILLRRHPE